MTAKEHELIQLLETRIRQLLEQDEDLREQCRVLEATIAERDGQIVELECQKQELKAQYYNLKVARILELSDSDTRNARQKINRLVRDVDKCIALLKA